MEGTYFQWDKDFLTGLNKIDEQHHGLVEIINDLLKFSLKSELIEIDEIDEILDRLTNYVVDHFQTEDELMFAYGIDTRHIELHERLHSDFVKNVNKYFSNKEELRYPEKLSEVSEFLVRWLAYHILNTDKSMVRQMEYIKNDGLTGVEAYEKDQSYVDTTTEPLLKALKALFFLVSQKNKELEIHNQELEIRVKERTIALEEANQKLHELSMNDVLTGLPNRRYIMGEIDRLIDHYERYHVVFSVLFIDLDKFKEVNDTHGHEKGDEVLKWISGFLKKNVRKTDITCRLGGDEFVVVSPHSSGDGALLLAKKLCEMVQSKESQSQIPCWQPSISIGVAEVNASVKTSSELLIRADSAMYEVKKRGRGGAHLLL
ncbi:MAG: GGDEF domain-containing protein [Clostridiales bacterium]|nr:GGDEF domain-containing protein [Clostridiales bacterium]